MIFLILAFIFQSSLTNTTGQQYLIGCPFPINDGSVVIGNPALIGSRLNYTVSYGNGSSSDMGAYFQCSIVKSNPLLLGANIQVKPYPATLGSCSIFCIPYGYASFLGDNLYHGLSKIQPALTLIYIYATAPAQVTGLAWFNYIQLFLLLLIGLGIAMLIRGV